jgi:tetratricopeptide (TPR) repeat protein
MAILAAIGWDRLIRLLPRPGKLAVGAVLLAGMVHPTLHILKNHPLEYIYFNELLGIRKAYGRFETDYYMNSLKQGSEWLAENVLRDVEPDENNKVLVATNGSVTYYLRHFSDRAHPVYTRYYDRAERDWDYAVYFCNYIHPYQLKNGLWPPAGTIHTIDIKGVPVCAIVKRETKEDMEAIGLIRQRDYLNGLARLEVVNREYPTSEVVKLRMAEGYLATGQMDKAISVCNECLEIYPDYDKALNLKGVAQMEKGDLESARQTFLKIIRINYRFAPAYHNMGLYFMRLPQPDVQSAVTYFQRCINVNRAYKPSYLALAAIYRQQGMIDQAVQYENAANSL